MNIDCRILIECLATASGDRNSVALRIRHEGETLKALLQPLDNAIAHFYGDGKMIDEINGPWLLFQHQGGIAGRSRCAARCA